MRHSDKLVFTVVLGLVVMSCGGPALAQGFFRSLKHAVEDTVRGAADITKGAVDATVDTVDDVTDSPSYHRTPQRAGQTDNSPHTTVPYTSTAVPTDSNSDYANAKVPPPDPRPKSAEVYKFGGYDSEPGDNNVPVMGASIPVPIPDHMGTLVALPVDGPPRQEDINVPTSVATQINQQFHSSATAVIGGKRKNGFPVVDETYVRINGEDYRFRIDGSWCHGCSGEGNSGIKPGAVILTGGKFYRLNPATSKWQYYSKP